MPQPIDMQTELARTLVAERIQDASARAALLAQQRAQVEEERVRAAQQAQVTESKQADNREVRDKEEHGEPREHGRKRNTAAPQAPAEAPPAAPRKALEPGAEHGFDVSI
jgi:hypothetical protein